MSPHNPRLTQIFTPPPLSNLQPTPPKNLAREKLFTTIHPPSHHHHHSSTSHQNPTTLTDKKRGFLHGIFRKRHPRRANSKQTRAFYRSESLPNLDEIEKDDGMDTEDDFVKVERKLPRGASLDAGLGFNGYHPDPPLAVFGEEEEDVVGMCAGERSDSSGMVCNVGESGDVFVEETYSSVQNSIGEIFGEEEGEVVESETSGDGVLKFCVEDLLRMDDAEIVNRVMQKVKEFRRREIEMGCGVKLKDVQVVSESRRCMVEDARLMNMALVPKGRNGGQRCKDSTGEDCKKEGIVGGKLGVQGLVKMVAERQMAHGAILKAGITRRVNHTGDTLHKHSPLRTLRRTRSTHDTSLIDEEEKEKRPRLRRLRSLHTLTRTHSVDGEEVEQPRKPLVKDVDHTKMGKKHSSKESKPFHMFRRRHSMEYEAVAPVDTGRKLGAFNVKSGHEMRSKSVCEEYESYHPRKSSAYNVKRKRSVLIQPEDRTEIKAVPIYGVSSDSSETTISSHQEFRSDYDDFHLRKVKKPVPRRKPNGRVGLATIFMSRLRRPFNFRRW